MKQNFDTSLKRVLKSEGGYTNDPQDPGGPTNFGITIHDYRAYIDRNGTALDVKKMTVDQAAKIYKSKYWDTVNGDELPSGVDYCVFDYGVNSGVSRANRVLRQVGPNIDAICDERLRFLHGLRTWPHFGKGWASRVAYVRAGAKQMALKSTLAPSIPVPVPTPKPVEEKPWITTVMQNLLQRLKQFFRIS